MDVLNMIKQWCGWMNDRIHGKGGVGTPLPILEVGRRRIPQMGLLWVTDFRAPELENCYSFQVSQWGFNYINMKICQVWTGIPWVK